MVDIKNGQTGGGAKLVDEPTELHGQLFELALEKIGFDLDSDAKDNVALEKDYLEHCIDATKAAAKALGLDENKASSLVNPSVANGSGGWADDPSKFYAHPSYDGGVLARQGETPTEFVYADTWVKKFS